MITVQLSLYAIYCVEDNETIWSARGGAYQQLVAVKKKIQRLKKRFPDKTYNILKYTLADMIEGEDYG